MTKHKFLVLCKTPLNTMQALQSAIILLHLSLILCKRKYRDSSSEESIENVLYYQDCQHKKDQPTPEKLRSIDPPTTPRQPQECKMCCTMCCGDECQQSVAGKPRSMPMSQAPRQPPFINRQPKIEPARLNPIRQQRPRIPPFFGRRDFGSTKDNIKTIISQDSDIRKILKDLVRVTMQKVDLMKMMKSTDRPTGKDSVYENDL